VPFPPLAERFERLEETILICLQMWSDNNGPFYGQHYRLEETLCSPKPVSTPRPRILIGGSGERKTLRLVAQYADACNIIGAPDEVVQKIDVLKRHCDAVGRDPNEIEVTAMYRDFPADATVDDIVQGAEALARIGVSTVVAGAEGDDPAGSLEATFGPAMERITAIEPTRLI
jgi:alkanesulfonate monooxygenase SsuD/methylene tetrahydromethanopterin reductase-like flavin-dependent oxidoreductase (luciferase family)